MRRTQAPKPSQGTGPVPPPSPASASNTTPAPKLKKTSKPSSIASNGSSSKDVASTTRKSKRIGASNRAAPLPLDFTRNNKDLEEAIATASFAKFSGSSGKVLPNILSRSRGDIGSISFQYSNISPPSSFLAAKAFDQLALLLAEPIAQLQPTSSTGVATANTEESAPMSPLILTPNSVLPVSANPIVPSVKSLSAPNSRKGSEVPSPPSTLPRHSSDPMIYAPSPPQNPAPPTTERDLRRRIVKLCLEIKRILDKENVTLVSDSPLHKIFFSKYSSASGASLLLKCIRIIPDVDICIIVTNLLLRIITSASDTTSNIAFLARKNASVAVVSCLVGIVTATSASTSSSSATASASAKKKDDLVTNNPVILGGGAASLSGGKGKSEKSGNSGLPSGVPSLAARMDEAIINIFSVIIKLAKHDPKLPVIARLHGSVEIVTDIVKKWHDRKDSTAVILGFQVLRVLAVKNESNIMIMHKRGILETISGFFKANSLGAIRDAKENQGFEVAMDLLALYAKHETVVIDIIGVFGIQYFLNLFNSLGSAGAVGNETIRKSILKLLRAVVETGPGRKEFNTTDGLEILTTSLEEIIQQNDLSISFTSNTTNTIPSLLVAVLRSAVAETDLPHIDHIHHRYFPLPPDKEVAVPNTENPVSLETKLTVLSLDDSKSTESSPNLTPALQRTKKLANRLSKQNSNSQIPLAPASTSSLNLELPAPLSAEDEAFLTSLCPEFHLQNWCPPPILDIPTRILKSVYPTNFDVPGVPFILNRDPDDYRPSLKFPINMTSAGASMNSGIRPMTAQASSSNSAPLVYQSPVPREVEPQCKKSNNMMRRTIYEQTSRILRPGMYSDLMVYDVMDEKVRSHALTTYPDVLMFESRFESGNLQLAIKVQPTEYDLILQSDIGSKPGRHNQWFYFSVANMTPSVSYKFNIINMSKGNSQFGEGMQPVIYSVKDGVWRRGGENICFYKNHYRKPDGSKSDEPVTNSTANTSKLASSIPTYSTLTFHLKTPHPDDTIFIAYHYPYTVSDLTLFLDSLQVGRNGLLELQREGQTNTVKSCDKFNKRCRRHALGSSVGGNKVELLTITAFDEESINESPISDRIYIFLTGRVHPGESNSSYIMHGVIQFLLSDDDTAHCLRQKCVFKIVPMLNPDGVIAGNHRCGLGGTDLNRAWQSPSATRTPTIYWTKMLWKFLVDKGHRPLVSCDFHGHSKKKNVFIFGCENGPGLNDGIEKIFPSLLATLNPVFDPSNCKYTVEKSKEATARVVMWREFGIVGSYTLESSYCGTDVGEKKGLQLQITDLEKVGVDFCCAIWASLGIFEGRVPIATPAPLQSKKDKSALNVLGGIGTALGPGADSDSSCDDREK